MLHVAFLVINYACMRGLMWYKVALPVHIHNFMLATNKSKHEDLSWYYYRHCFLLNSFSRWTSVVLPWSTTLWSKGRIDTAVFLNTINLLFIYEAKVLTLGLLNTKSIFILGMNIHCFFLGVDKWLTKYQGCQLGRIFKLKVSISKFYHCCTYFDPFINF